MKAIKLFISFLFILTIVACSTNDNSKQMEAKSKSQTSTSKELTTTSTQLTTQNPSSGSFTLTEISQHSIEGDCWLLINSKVYDVSKFTPNHPGGDAIFEGCGIDATELYFTRPMGSNTPHSEKAQAGLEKFYIGDLK